MRARDLAAGLALVALLASVAAGRAETLDGGRYGPVEVAVPRGDIRGYVVLFSDPDATTPPVDPGPLTRAGALVVSVDTPRYFAAIRRDAKPCDQLVGDAETLSRQLQRLHPGPDYAFPVLAGVGAGGTLAYAVLAQAPNNTLAGAVALDPAPALSGIPPLCPGAPATAEAEGATRYVPKPDLQGFWSVGLDADAPASSREAVAALAAAGVATVEVALAGKAPAAALAALVEPHLSRATNGGVAALPLVDLPAAHPGPLMAVVMSGDGGWRDIDKSIAENLQERGISVVGWDSLRYFWREKTPEQTGDDMAAVLRAYLQRWSARRVALIGYSFGADVMPSVYDRLPQTLRDRVALVSLLGVEPKADWEITVRGWLGEPPSEAGTPVAPALARVPDGIVQCIFGAEEPDSLCPGLPPGIERVRMPGGHHFGGDYKVLTDRIVEALMRRAGP